MGQARLRKLISEARRTIFESDFEDRGTGFGGAGERAAAAPMTAYNPSEAERAFDDLIGTIVNSVHVRYGTPRDLAVGLIVKVGREYAVSGRLPPFPRYNASDLDLAKWTAAVNSSDFKDEVLTAAKALHDAESEAWGS